MWYVIFAVAGFSATPAIASEVQVIDFAPLISEVIVPIAAAVISGLLWSMARRFGLEIDRRALLDAVEAKAREVVAKKGPITIGASDEVAKIANYVIEHTPQAAKRLGLTVSDGEGRVSAGAALTRVIETRIAGAALEASTETKKA